MRKTTKGLISAILFLILFSCGNATDGESIKWHNKEGGIKSWEKTTQNGITKIICYYKDGVKKELEEYKEKIKHGKWIKWYKNGKIESEKTYDNGRKVGNHKKFYDNGQISQDQFYTNDEKSGTWILYYPNGDEWKKDTY